MISDFVPCCCFVCFVSPCSLGRPSEELSEEQWSLQAQLLVCWHQEGKGSVMHCWLRLKWSLWFASWFERDGRERVGTRVAPWPATCDCRNKTSHISIQPVGGEASMDLWGPAPFRLAKPCDRFRYFWFCLEVVLNSSEYCQKMGKVSRKVSEKISLKNVSFM